MNGANGPDVAAVYQLLTQVARTVTGHDRKLDDLAAGFASRRGHPLSFGHGLLISKLDERVRRIERHLGIQPAGN